MKKAILTVVIMLAALVMSGQTSERTSAYNYHKYGKLDKAKESIDKAAQHEKTIMDAKTWFYRGNIYYDIAINPDSNVRNLDPDPFRVAFDSYMKAKELDTKGEFTDEINKFTAAVGEGYYNNGVMYYNEQDYVKASANFAKAFEVSKAVNRTDTSALINAAISASFGENYKAAKNYYQELIDMNVQRADLYTSLTEIYKAEGDTAMALQVAAQGRQMFPDDFNLLIAETNIFLATNEQEKAIANLEKAKEIDKTNPSIFFAVGTIYDQLQSEARDRINLKIGLSSEEVKASYGAPIEVNKTTSEYGITEQWVYNDLYLYFDDNKLSSWQERITGAFTKFQPDSLFKKAEYSYKKAIELDPPENHIRVGISYEEAYKIFNEAEGNIKVTENGDLVNWYYDNLTLYFEDGKLKTWKQDGGDPKPSIAYSASYNLGALYVNRAADILDKANNLPLDAVAEYDAAKLKAEEMLHKAVPYLEKALELMPDDVNTMVSLKEIYTRLGMTEKLKVIDEKIKN